MMIEIKVLERLINNHEENDFVDYKECYYEKDKKHELIKDIVSFSNNNVDEDKYIIFGVVDSSCVLKNVSYIDIPDISDINVLLDTYVEPYITIELEKFVLNGFEMACIKIPKNNDNRPYMIKKNFQKNGQTFLRIGEIFIRKGANNFVANRRDLDTIYKLKGTVDIDLYDDSILIGYVNVAMKRTLMGQCRIKIENTKQKTVLIDKIYIDTICSSNHFQVSGDFVDDMGKDFEKQPTLIKDSPICLNSGCSIQKSVYFSLSNELSRILFDKNANKEQFLSVIKIADIDGNEYISKEKDANLNFYGDAKIFLERKI